jgi:DNA-binding protein HU-beta
MNKTELIDKMADHTGFSKVDAKRAAEAFIAIITDSLAEGEEVVLVGFGTFAVSKRSARKGRNPQNGKEINIPARTVPKFKAGKALKDIVR